VPYLFTPSEANRAVQELADRQAANKDKGIIFPPEFTTVRKYAPPLNPGQIWVVQSCPGEGKSVLASWWKRYVRSLILQRAGDDIMKVDQAILSVVLEETMEVERLRTMSTAVNTKDFFAGTLDRRILLDALSRSASDPIFYMGPSITGDIIHPKAREFKPLTTEDIGVAGYEIQTDYNFDLATAVIDYFQLLHDTGHTREMTPRVQNVAREIITVAQNVLKCPTLVNAQSDLKKVKERASKVPGMEDIQWSSEIPQAADIVWGLWKPSKDQPTYKPIIIPSEGKQYKIPALKDLLIVKVNKWRGEERMDGQVFVLCFGRPWGTFFEVDLEILSRQDPERLAAEGIYYYMDIPESRLLGS
jgi:replicative DNA helicase